MANQGENSGKKAGPRQTTIGKWHKTADFLLVFLVMLVAGGDRVPAVNEAHYVTRLKHFWNPEWVTGDLFLDSPDAHLTVVLLLGWTTLWLPLAAVAWLGRLLSWALIAWAWRRLSWRVTPRWGVAALTAALWCVGVQDGHFAGEWVVGGFEAKGLAYAFVLAALGSWLHNEWNRVWLFLGMATALHALVGGWSIVLIGALWLRKQRSPNQGWLELQAMSPGLIVGGLIGLAGVAPPLWMNAGVEPGVAAEAAEVYVFERLPHHLAPLSKGGAWLAERAAQHLVVLACLVAATRGARRTDHAPLRQLCRYAWAAAGVALVGLLIEGALSSNPAQAASLLRYYWFRTTDFAAPMAASLGIGAWLVANVEAKPRTAGVGLAAAVLLAAYALLPGVVSRVRADQPPADKDVYDYNAWIDACRWAREKTEPGTLFLTPRRAHTFHWRAERPEVVVYKNIPQNATGLIEWRRRMWQVHRRPGAGTDPRYGWATTPGALGAQQLLRLADQYAFDYVLSDRRRPVSLPIAYRNRSYTVYDVSDRSAAPSQSDRPVTDEPATDEPVTSSPSPTTLPP